VLRCLGEVRVAAGRERRHVPEEPTDLLERDAGLHERGRVGVPEIVDPQRIELGVAERGDPEARSPVW